MNFTKYDIIQMVFNTFMIAATVMNIMFMTGRCALWVVYLGFALAITGCVITNLSTSRKKDAMRETVHGSQFLAGLSYVTGAAWIITFAVIMFFGMNTNM